MSDQCSGTCCLAEASWSDRSCLNWSLHTHSRACCLTILSLRNKHLCTQSWWLISAQQSQCRTPTWKYLLTPMLWKPRKSSVSASLPAPALATHIFSEPPNSIKSSAISSERGNSKSCFPRAGHSAFLLSLCCPAQKASPAVCTSCSSAAAALLVQQEESFFTAAADRWADKLPLPPHVPSPMALQQTRRTIPVTKKSSGVKHPARINPI